MDTCQKLRLIAEIFGPGEAYNRLLDYGTTEVIVWIPVPEILRLLPKEYSLVAPEDTARFTPVPVGFQNLFSQIESGTVQTPLAELVAYLPLSFTGLIPRDLRKEPITVPLEIVKSCLYSPQANALASLPWER